MGWLRKQIEDKIDTLNEDNIIDNEYWIGKDEGYRNALIMALSLMDQVNCKNCRFNDICDKMIVLDADTEDYTNIESCSKFSNFGECK
jgi:hypothetical protein